MTVLDAIKEVAIRITHGEVVDVGHMIQIADAELFDQLCQSEIAYASALATIGELAESAGLHLVLDRRGANWLMRNPVTAWFYNQEDDPGGDNGPYIRGMGDLSVAADAEPDFEAGEQFPP